MKRQKYLYADADRRGNQRLYFSPPGCKKIRIRAAAGTREAKLEYTRLMKLYESGADLEKATRVERGSVEWLLNRYMASTSFATAAPNTRIQRSNFYKRFCRKHGHVPYGSITSRDLAAVRDALKPGAGRNFLNSMSAAYKWACSEEVALADSNPAEGVRRPKQSAQGYRKWSLDDVIAFKDHHRKGSNARKSLAMLLFTAREISGVRELGRGDVRDGRLRGHRKKTWANSTVPVLDILRDELGESYNDLVWLRASHGGPYSEKSLSQRFSKWAREAGLEGLSSHGLRKSVATILAELGLSERTIMAVLAHTDPRQAQTYVQDANDRALATQGLLAFEAEISLRWNDAEAV